MSYQTHNLEALADRFTNSVLNEVVNTIKKNPSFSGSNDALIKTIKREVKASVKHWLLDVALPEIREQTNVNKVLESAKQSAIDEATRMIALSMGW